MAAPKLTIYLLFLMVFISLAGDMANASEVPNFRLLDSSGNYHELRRSNAKAVVLFVAGNGCPIVRQSATKLRSLRRKFAEQGIDFLMINANPQDDRSAINKEASE